jgi:hypothetical protein
MSTSTKDHRASVRADPTVGTGAPVVLVQFSTRLAPELLSRLRVAAPQLGMRQSDIAAEAIDGYLRRRGF